jgi:hypothetical protein
MNFNAWPDPGLEPSLSLTGKSVGNHTLGVGNVWKVSKPHGYPIFGSRVIDAENDCSDNNDKSSKSHWIWFLIFKS